MDRKCRVADLPEWVPGVDPGNESPEFGDSKCGPEAAVLPVTLVRTVGAHGSHGLVYSGIFVLMFAVWRFMLVTLKA